MLVDEFDGEEATCTCSKTAHSQAPHVTFSKVMCPQVQEGEQASRTPEEFQEAVGLQMRLLLEDHPHHVCNR